MPDEVSSLQFDDISDRAVRVLWSPPKKSNGVLIGYKLSYQVTDNNDTYKEEILPPNVTSIKVEQLQVRLGRTKYLYFVFLLDLGNYISAKREKCLN